MRREALNGFAANQDRARRRTDKAADQVQRGRLAAAGRPEQAEELALGDLEVDRAERLLGAVALRDPAELGLGCLAACRELGVTLPDELALATFDDPYFGALLEPSLTAVGYDPAEVGRSAASMLVDAMRGGELVAIPVPGNSHVTLTGVKVELRREVRVPVQLVRRRSCGCEEPQ